MPSEIPWLTPTLWRADSSNRHANNSDSYERTRAPFHVEKAALAREEILALCAFATQNDESIAACFSSKAPSKLYLSIGSACEARGISAQHEGSILARILHE